MRGLLIARGLRVFKEGDIMIETTCAACDCKLDGNPIKVKIGDKSVEVCSDERVQTLKEAHVAATTSRKR